MSAPRNRTRPAVGARNPVTRLKSVVLPAPFGPISPTISPSRTVNETPSTARSPPNVRDRPETSSTAPPPQQRAEPPREDGTEPPREDGVEHPVRQIRGHEDEDRAVEEQPVFFQEPERLRQHRQRHAAQDRPDEGAGAPEHRIREDRHSLAEGRLRGVDQIREVDREPSGQAGDEAGDRKRQ